MSSRITYCKDIYYFQVFLLVPAKGCSIFYCSILWYDCSKTALKNLRIAYNNSLRKLLGISKYNSASEMFVCLNIPSFNELLRKYVYSYRSRLLASHNCILLSMCSSVVPLYSPIMGLVGMHSHSIVRCNILYLFIVFLARKVI